MEAGAVSGWLVFGYASLTALATGLGALPFYLIRQNRERWLGIGNAIAAGLMLAASFNLIFEGNAVGIWRTFGGIVLGLAVIVFARRWIESHKVPSIEELPEADAVTAVLMVGVMTVHSFAEGVGVGVSFADGAEFGTFISLAIAVHNIPEGLAISLVMTSRGVPIWRAALWSIFSSLPQPLTAVPSFWFVETFKPVLPVGLGLAAGAMIWMCASELMPQANERERPQFTAIALTLAVAAMVAFQALIHP